MKWIVIFHLFACLSCELKAQPIYDFADKIKKRYPSDKKITRVIRQFSSHYPEFKLTTINERINYYETLESEILINRYKNNDSRDSLKDSWSLFKIVKDGRLIFLRLERIRENGFFVSYNPLVDLVDTNSIRERFARFHKTGTVNFTLPELITGTGHDIYGIGWGLSSPNSPEVQEPMEEVYKEVVAKDTTKLLWRCRSKCNETKAYGATGLFLLQKEGMVLNANTSKILKDILLSEGRISFAPGGCIIYSRVRIKQSLTPDYLEEVYQSYKWFTTGKGKKNILRIIETLNN